MSAHPTREWGKMMDESHCFARGLRFNVLVSGFGTPFGTIALQNITE